MKRIKLEVYDEQEFHASHGKQFVSNCILCKKENQEQARRRPIFKTRKLSRLRSLFCQETEIPITPERPPGGLRQSIKIDPPKRSLLLRMSHGSKLAGNSCWMQESIEEKKHLSRMPDLFATEEKLEPTLIGSTRLPSISSTNSIIRGKITGGAGDLSTGTITASAFGSVFPKEANCNADGGAGKEVSELKTARQAIRSQTPSSLYTEVSGIYSSPPQSKQSPRTKKDAYKMFEKGMQDISSLNWDTVERGLEQTAIVLNSAPTPDAAQTLLGNRLPMLMSTITSLVRSFRPKVSIAACRAATAIFAIVPNCTQRPLFDQLVASLLMKTADINKTLKEEALRALGCMAEYLPNFHVVRTLSQICGGFENGHLRAAAAHTIYIMAQATAPYYIVDDKQVRELLCPLLASLMEDGHSEARHYARLAFQSLLRYYRFYHLFRVTIDPAQLQRLYKTIDKLCNLSIF